MSAMDPFKQVQDRYYSLRSQLDAKRITPEQFETALKELMVQDEQGRYWMLGAQSGAWYVYDGQQWVQDTPPSYGQATLPTYGPAAPQAYGPTEAPDYGATIPPPATVPTSSRTPILPLFISGVAIVLLLILGGAFILTRQNSPALVQYITATSLPQVTSPATVARPTDTTVPSATSRPTTPLPDTATPVRPTETETLPTAFPSSTPLPAPATPTAKPLPPTAMPASPVPTNTPAPRYPPGVYVTQIVSDPAQPKRTQGVTFAVTFVNTTGAGQSYNWLVQIYDSDTQKRFGETLVQPITVPPGTTHFTTANNWAVIGKGDCKAFYAQAQYQNPDSSRIPFNNTDGSVVSYGFQVCP